MPGDAWACERAVGTGGRASPRRAVSEIQIPPDSCGGPIPRCRPSQRRTGKDGHARPTQCPQRRHPRGRSPRTSRPGLIPQHAFWGGHHRHTRAWTSRASTYRIRRASSPGRAGASDGGRAGRTELTGYRAALMRPGARGGTWGWGGHRRPRISPHQHGRIAPDDPGSPWAQRIFKHGFFADATVQRTTSRGRHASDCPGVVSRTLGVGWASGCEDPPSHGQ